MTDWGGDGLSPKNREPQVTFIYGILLNLILFLITKMRMAKTVFKSVFASGEYPSTTFFSRLVVGMFPTKYEYVVSDVGERK